jgi:hypothetical protein
MSARSDLGRGGEVAVDAGGRGGEGGGEADGAGAGGLLVMGPRGTEFPLYQLGGLLNWLLVVGTGMGASSPFLGP